METKRELGILRFLDAPAISNPKIKEVVPGYPGSAITSHGRSKDGLQLALSPTATQQAREGGG
eukprot:2262493-Rhodomonas_salina.2